MRLFQVLSLIIPATAYNAIVIGGGPSGLLSAIALTRRAKTVTVFEKSLDESIDTSKNYNLVLSQRGINALNRFNINYLDDSVLVDKVVRHGFSNDDHVSVGCPESISISRRDLIKCIRKEAESRGVNIQEATFFSPDLKLKEIHTDKGEFKYDLLVGSDGSNSKVRKSLEMYVPDFTTWGGPDDRMFKTFRMDHEELKRIDGYNDEWDTGFHVWQGAVSELICPPTSGGGITGTFVSKAGFDTSIFPQVFDNMDSHRLNEVHESIPRQQRYVYCSHVGLGNVLLTGDAAHSMPASLGQGVNAALEDAVCLDRCLSFRLHVDEMVANYHRCRIHDSHAVCDLSKRAFGGGDRSNRGHNVKKMMAYIGRADISYSDILSFT